MYSVFMSSHMYVLDYTRDFIVYLVLKISCCLQARNELNKYIKDYYVNKIKLSKYFPFIDISKDVSVT